MMERPRPETGVDLEGSAPGLETHRFAHEAMATVFEVVCTHEDPGYAAQAAQAAFALLDRLERELSRFLPNSDVSRVNALDAGQGTRVTPTTMECLEIARRMYDLTDRTFERIFGVMMLVMLIPTLRHVTAPPSSSTPGGGWHPAVAAPIYFVLGLYSGALHAGVGLPLLFALVHAGHDVVRANAIKVAVIAGAALAAVPVFALRGQVAWGPALALALGFSMGGLLGARLVVREGEKVVRPVLVIAVIALAARMLGLY